MLYNIIYFNFILYFCDMKTNYFIAGFLFAVIIASALYYYNPKNTGVNNKLQSEKDSLLNVNMMLELEIKASNNKLKRYEKLDSIITANHNDNIDLIMQIDTNDLYREVIKVL